MSDRPFAGRWLCEDDSAVLFGSDGWTPVAGAGRRPGGYVGWIWERGALGTLRLVQTDTVPSLDDAMRAADELVLAQERAP